ncbi:MAG TPA: hypothetical protein ENJ09_15700 [Planctomycetes bacterium]|nr:hypothetical protein [Planctomycetota bacterium]
MSTTVELFAVEPAPEGARLVPIPHAVEGPRPQTAIESLGLAPGIYTGLRTFGGDRFLCLREHLDRMERSMHLAGWGEARLDRKVLRRALAEVVRDRPNGGEDWNLRVDVFPPGSSLPGSNSRLLIARWPHHELPAAFRRDGVRLGVAERLHRFQPRVKAAEFAARRAPFPLVTREAFDHVMLDEAGRILEATSANVYLVRSRTLHTAGSGVLEGITRRIVLELAEAAGLEIRLEAPALDEVGSFDEGFLSSSTRGIVPVIGIGEHTFASATPGPVTRSLAAALERATLERARPAWPPPAEESGSSA